MKIDKLCKTCIHDCKQWFEVVSCPKYKRIPRKKKKERMEVKKWNGMNTYKR